MKVAFFSNYLNHHQLPLAQALYELTNHQYVFVATKEISQARLDLGYPDMNNAYPFVLRAYESEDDYQKAMEIAKTCDVMISGSAPEEFTYERLQTGKLTFRYSERIYREKMSRENIRDRMRAAKCTLVTNYRYPHYMLCSSAYTAADHATFGNYIGRTYKWGYFPEVKKYDSPEALMDMKQNEEKVQLLWVGRLLELKRAETAIYTAEYLKEMGCSFELNIIGTGDQEEKLSELIETNDLKECVHMLGAFPPEKVREYMEKANIFLFTSNRMEGWGAVLNEAMNSGCAVVACDAIGSVPYLIDNGKNGIIYHDGNQAQLNRAVLSLVNNDEKQKMMGINAYETMLNTWNADEAAKRFLKLCEVINSGRHTPYKSGPCSRAHIFSKKR